MISFRYHVVSLVAVLLALAVGIVLGSGPLQRDTDEDTAGDGDRQALLAAEADVDRLEQIVEYDDAFAEATSAGLLRRKLDGRAVTLVALPGADEAALTRLTESVDRAGGRVTAQVVVAEALLEVDNRQLVDELASQMHDTARKQVDVPAGASGYERMGRLLAYAVGSTKKAGERTDRAAESILAGVSTAELVTTRGNVSRRGSLVLVVTGPPVGTADDRAGAGSILATLADAFAQGTDGVVVAGPVSAGAEDGLVAAVRSDPTAAASVSTVDVVERVSGAVVAVLALAGEASGEQGHYGSAAAADGPLPD